MCLLRDIQGVEGTLDALDGDPLGVELGAEAAQPLEAALLLLLGERSPVRRTPSSAQLPLQTSKRSRLFLNWIILFERVLFLVAFFLKSALPKKRRGDILYSYYVATNVGNLLIEIPIPKLMKLEQIVLNPTNYDLCTYIF